MPITENINWGEDEWAEVTAITLRLQGVNYLKYLCEI
jgi:hypothetical protein